MSNPYEVERTTMQYGRASNVSADIPEGVVITLVHLSGTDLFELFVNEDQIGPVQRADFEPIIRVAAAHLKENK